MPFTANYSDEEFAKMEGATDNSYCYKHNMMARNHIPFAMSCWWLYAIATKQPMEAPTTMTAAIGGLLPDLDHPESALGRRIPLISVPLSALVGHRGMTHSLLAVVLLLGVLITMTTFSMTEHAPTVQALIPPLIVGYLSHILGDSMTPSGVPLFWPRKRTYSFRLFKTWSWQETVFTGVFTFAVVLLGGVAQAVFADLLQQNTGQLLQAVRRSHW